MAKTDTHKRGQHKAKRIRSRDSDSGRWVVDHKKSFPKVRTTSASAKAMDETEAMFSRALSRLAKK